QLTGREQCEVAVLGRRCTALRKLDVAENLLGLQHDVQTKAIAHGATRGLSDCLLGVLAGTLVVAGQEVRVRAIAIRGGLQIGVAGASAEDQRLARGPYGEPELAQFSQSPRVSAVRGTVKLRRVEGVLQPALRREARSRFDLQRPNAGDRLARAFG